MPPAPPTPSAGPALAQQLTPPALPTDFLDDEDDGELLDGLEPTEAPGTQGGRRLAAPTEAPATPALPTPPAPLGRPTPRHSRALSWAARPLPLFWGRAPPPRPAAAAERPPKVYVTRVRPGLRVPPQAPAPLSPRGPPRPPFPGVFLRPRPLPRVQLRARPRPPRARGRRTGGPQAAKLRPPAPAPTTQGSREGQAREPGLTAPTTDSNYSSEAQPVTSFLSLSQVPGENEEEEEGDDEEGAQGEEAALEDSEEKAGAVRGRWREDAVNWQRTFSVGSVDFEVLRSDWNDLRCNVSGNLQLQEAEAVDVVAQYMERLNARHGGYEGGARMEMDGLGLHGTLRLPQGLMGHCSGNGTRPPPPRKCLLTLLGPLTAQGPRPVLGAFLPSPRAGSLVLHLQTPHLLPWTWT